MTLKGITDSVGIFTDENFQSEDLLIFANRGIAKINNSCKTKFADYVSITDDYKDFPDQWQKDLIGNYIAYGIKMNDTSLTEADRYLKEFYDSLKDFKENLGTLVESEEIDVSKVELDGFGGVYGIDTSNAINVGWFGN